jgi:hypothetical protein
MLCSSTFGPEIVEQPLKDAARDIADRQAQIDGKGKNTVNGRQKSVKRHLSLNS